MPRPHPLDLRVGVVGLGELELHALGQRVVADLRREQHCFKKNGEGRYYADKETLKSLKKNNQIVFTYGEEINGASLDIAGICNKQGNVVGMMPHPERSAESIINPNNSKPASLIFESLLNTLGVAQ